MNIENFSFNTLKTLQEDPRRYRNFGVYWYLIKSVLKRFYTQDNLHLLGNYQDASVIERMPDHGSLDEALQAAIQTYNLNTKFNMLSSNVVDPAGEEFSLIDEDAAGI